MQKQWDGLDPPENKTSSCCLLLEAVLRKGIGILGPISPQSSCWSSSLHRLDETHQLLGKSNSNVSNEGELGLASNAHILRC